ncbi:reverse transcriptase [Tanacetum coccineum]
MSTTSKATQQQQVPSCFHYIQADPDPGSYFVIIQFKKLLFSYNNFTCDDVLSWLYMVNKFFEMDHIDVDAQKIRLVSMHTFGKALNWHKHFMAKHGAIMTWDLYQTHIKKRFESVFEDPIVALKNLKLTTTVQVYQESFKDFLNKVDLSDEYAVSLFIGGLKEDIAYAVRMFKPNNLSDVFCLSKLQEASNSMTKGKHTSWTASSKSNVTHNVNKEGGNAFKTTNPNRPFRSGQLFSLEVVGEEMVMEENADLQLNGEGVDEPPLISLNALTGEIWLSTLGWIRCDFRNLIMEYTYKDKKVVLRGTQQATVQSMEGKSKQGKKFMNVELSAMGVCVCRATFMNMEAESSHSTDVKVVLEEFDSVFDVPKELPPKRTYNHRIPT